MITIFTPTYNRAFVLHKLYNSLLMQTVNEFIWIIVDDGSVDNTFELIEKWKKDDKIKIEYYKQENSGKSWAHNIGVELTNTELFTCVDSDDYLSVTAVEEIKKCWDYRDSTKNIIGIIAFKGHSIGDTLTTLKNNSICSSTLRDAYRKHGLRGDTMLIFDTHVIKRYKFPRFSGEKFVPEAFLYDQIDQDGEMLVYRKILYLCEYLEDGYSKHMAQLLFNNPKGYLAYIKQRLLFDKSINERVTDTIRYTAICLSNREDRFIKKSVYPILTILTLPLASLFYVLRYRKYDK
jgi:glycosyltransferase involved in cell wall biosynthesis